VLRADGTAVTPPLARGAQAGIGRAVLLAARAELREADVHGAELATARALAVVNAVRGVRLVVALGGRAVGGAGRETWAERLARAFLAAA
jgi:branched-subunit amino acid aminotransferase/4-amino-4-deoxychorismate lyase